MTLIQKTPPAAVMASTFYRSTQSLSFNGVDDWAVVYNIFGTDTFTITRIQKSTVNVWVKSTKNDASIEQIIIGRWNPHQSLAVNESGWRIYLWDAQGAGEPLVNRALVFHLCTHLLNGVWFYSQASFPLNQWVMVTLTWDGFAAGSIAGLKMYWDGVQVPTWLIFDNWYSNTVGSSAYSHLLWGVRYSAWWPGGAMPDWPPILGGWFEGLLDGTTVWRHELSATEVAGLYRGIHPMSPLNVGLPYGHPVDGHWRHGDGSDGDPFLGLLRIMYGRYPVGAPFRNAFWNNPLATRITTDVAP